jgi:phage baseplate assembly protein V
MLGKLAALVGLGKIAGTRDDAPVRVAQVWLSEVDTRDQTAMLQHYGFSSRPHPGADTAHICLGGDKSKMVVIATHDQRYFVALAEGEVCIHDDLGRSFKFTRAGIAINGGGSPITITNATTLTQNGDIHATGAIIAGFGGGDQVGLQTHRHGTGTASAGTVTPTPGT